MKMVNKCYKKNNNKQANKEKLQKKACERCQNLSEEKKEKTRQYHRDRNKVGYEKVEYMRNYYLAHKK